MAPRSALRRSSWPAAVGWRSSFWRARELGCACVRARGGGAAGASAAAHLVPRLDGAEVRRRLDGRQARAQGAHVEGLRAAGGGVGRRSRALERLRGPPARPSHPPARALEPPFGRLDGEACRMKLDLASTLLPGTPAASAVAARSCRAAASVEAPQTLAPPGGCHRLRPRARASTWSEGRRRPLNAKSATPSSHRAAVSALRVAIADDGATSRGSSNAAPRGAPTSGTDHG